MRLRSLSRRDTWRTSRSRASVYDPPLLNSRTRCWAPRHGDDISTSGAADAERAQNRGVTWRGASSVPVFPRPCEARTAEHEPQGCDFRRVSGRQGLKARSAAPTFRLPLQRPNRRADVPTATATTEPPRHRNDPNRPDRRPDRREERAHRPSRCAPQPQRMNPRLSSFTIIRCAARSGVSSVVSMRISGFSGSSYGSLIPVKLLMIPARAFA